MMQPQQLSFIQQHRLDWEWSPRPQLDYKTESDSVGLTVLAVDGSVEIRSPCLDTTEY